MLRAWTCGTLQGNFAFAEESSRAVVEVLVWMRETWGSAWAGTQPFHTRFTRAAQQLHLEAYDQVSALCVSSFSYSFCRLCRLRERPTGPTATRHAVHSHKRS